MDGILDDLTRLSRSCQRAARPFQSEPLESMIRRLMDACTRLANAWCGSWLGHHSTIYTQNLRPPQAGQFFNIEWGGGEGYTHFTFEQVKDAILQIAGVTDLSPLTDASTESQRIFDQVQQDVLPTLDAVVGSRPDAALEKVRQEIAKLHSHMSREDYVNPMQPRGQILTRDSTAASGGLQCPLHLRFEAWVMSLVSVGASLKLLDQKIQYAIRYMERSLKMKGKSIAKKDGKIFLGHGRSDAWKDLRELITERLKLQYDEFNRESTAGKSNKERLQQMLDEASFAFLILTAEDETADGKLHARMNVIHEVGLFQGRLGFERAIILLEEGCEEFTNVQGISQIRFPKGGIKGKSEDIRQVLEREGIL